MSFSEFGSYVRQDFATLTDADMPVDALTARLMVNNAQHAFDESAQTLCNWADSTLSAATFSVTTAWTPLVLLGPFPARLRPSSGFYRYRLRVAIARTGANAVDFRFAIGTLASVNSALSTGFPATSLYSASINTTTVTAFTPGTSIITPLDSSVASSYAPIATKDGVPNPTSATVPTIWIGAAARSTVGTQTARLAGLYVAEYVGTP